MTENEAIKNFQQELKEPLSPFSITMCNLAIKSLEEIQKYRAIGTVEGYERAIETSKENYLLYAEYKSKLQAFESIGTIEEIKDLKEKSVPKKPILSKSMMTKKEFQICPVCERLVLYDGIKFDYCQYCGQKLDWKGGE